MADEIATGLDASGNPIKMQVVTEQEYAEREARRLQVDESPFISVDNGTQFAAALDKGKSIHLRGEGSEGIVNCKEIQHIRSRFTTIEGPGHLQFSVPPAPEVRCLWVSALDVTLRNFEMSSTRDLANSIDEGINIPAYDPSRSHRLKIQRLDMHHWCNCIGKWGGLPTPFTDDVLIEDCYLHTYRGFGIVLTFGVRRATVRRTRAIGKQKDEKHAQLDANAFYSNGHTEDILLEDSLFGGMVGMGIEMTTTPGGWNHRPRVVRCRVEDVKRFGVSFGHCIDGYGDHIIVDGAGGIGIEVAGDEVTGRAEGTTLVACHTRKIRNHLTPFGLTAGYTVDGSNDTLLLGCRATDIVSDPINESNGIYIVDSDRAVIDGCILVDAGAQSIHMFNGPDSLNTEGHHLVQGCSFRHTKNLAMPNEPRFVHRSVFVSNTNAVIRLNTTFVRPGGSMVYTCKNLPGASVHCDLDQPVTGETNFLGSNKLIPVP